MSRQDGMRPPTGIFSVSKKPGPDTTVATHALGSPTRYRRSGFAHGMRTVLAKDDAASNAETHQWHVGDSAHAHYSRNCHELPLQFAMKSQRLFTGVVCREWQRHIKRRDVGRIKSWLHAAKMHDALQPQARSSERNDRERHLPHHQPVANWLLAKVQASDANELVTVVEWSSGMQSKWNSNVHAKPREV